MLIQSFGELPDSVVKKLDPIIRIHNLSPLSASILSARRENCKEVSNAHRYQPGNRRNPDGVMTMICWHLPLGIVWPAIILPLVRAWCMITELGSILKNAVRMGAAVPKWLTKLLKASLKAVEQVGDGTTTEDPAES